jgi:heme/copper-type cytochrome/quinol oxidase subunit 1
MIQRLFLPLYNCFGTFGIVLLGLSFLRYQQTLDLHIHDTYYVIGLDFVCVLFGTTFLFFWIIYQLFRKRVLSTFLTNFHTLVTLGCIALLFVQPYALTLRNHLDYSLINSFNRLLAFTLLLLAIAQLLFLFNIIAGLFKKRK